MTVWSQSLGLQSKSHFEKVCLKLFLLLELFSDTEGWVSTTLAWTIKSEEPLKFEYYDWSIVTIEQQQLSVSRADTIDDNDKISNGQPVHEADNSDDEAHNVFVIIWY